MAVPGIGQYLRQISLAHQDSSYLHYEDIISGTRDATGNPTNPFPEVHGLSGTVRDPGDGQQKDDEDLARNNLRSVPKILENLMSIIKRIPVMPEREKIWGCQ